ncbi:hypothetical protein BM746_12310 [Shigella flexneri]|nr:hypothetical protein [Shigella flexneri]UUR55867.1 hypothetical protein BM746_12310 [Shigella flexneri]
MSHFWTGLCDEYARRRNRKRGLEFSDWAWLKQEWRRFTDRFVNSQAHIIMCGRAGYEYDFFEGDDGKRQLAKTGIKMKAETETGYEPSIRIQMEKQMNIETGQVWRTARILKDRSTRIDGQVFSNPTFKNFLPHIESLNLGGEHPGIDTSRDNSELFANDGTPTWLKEKRAKEIALDEIIELLNKHHGGTSNDAKRAKADLLEKTFTSRSWERIKGMDWPTIKAGRNALWIELEGVEYAFPDPQTQNETQQAGYDENIPV